MTDARFPERWLNDRRIRRLTPDAFRLFVLANAWSVSNRTDGRIERADLADLGAERTSVRELVNVGLWRPEDDGWQIVDFELVQTTRAQLAGLEHKRVMDRERQARKRAHDRGDHTHCLPEHCPDLSRVTSTVTSRVTQRTGQDRQDRHLGPSDSDPWADVHVAEIPS